MPRSRFLLLYLPLVSVACVSAPAEKPDPVFRSFGSFTLELTDVGSIRSFTGEDYVLLVEQRLTAQGHGASVTFGLGEKPKPIEIASFEGLVGLDRLETGAVHASVYSNSEMSGLWWDNYSGSVRAVDSEELIGRWSLSMIAKPSKEQAPRDGSKRLVIQDPNFGKE